MDSRDSSESIDIVANELSILAQWNSSRRRTTIPLSAGTTTKPAYSVCSYPNAEPFTLCHTKLITSVIKDVLLRMAQLNGFEPVLIDSIKEEAVQKFQDMQKTLDRLGCQKTIPREIPQNCASYVRAVQDVYSQLRDSNMIYREQKIMPYCIECRAPMSNFECNVRRPSKLIPHADVIFPLRSRSDVKVLVAITSAWTLAVNAALCVSPSSQYVEVLDRASNEKYIVAENRLQSLFPGGVDSIEILTSYRGESLRGIEYVPLFGYFAGAADETGMFRIICDEIVDSCEGTGIVSLAPHLIKEHFDLCVRENIVPAHALNASRPIDEHGRFTAPIDDLRGCNVFDCEKAVVMLAKAKGRVRETESRLCAVSTCLRCGTRLIEKPVLSQFIRVKSAIEKVREYASKTKWCPDFIWEFKMGEWLEDSDDWAISRFGGGGIPFPTAVNGPADVVESHPSSSNSPAAHQSVAVAPNEVFHSTFENAAAIVAKYRNANGANGQRTIDCIAENCEEAHPWFYTLLILSSLITDNFLVENVIVTDMVLKDLEDDMTVHRSTSPPVYNLLSRYGSDAYRLYCVNSIIKKEACLSLMEIEVNLLSRDVIRPFYSALQHILTGDRPFTFNSERLRAADQGSIDKWILSLYGQLAAGMTTDMANYHLAEVIPKIVDFMDELNKWYIHLNRYENSVCFKDVLFYILTHLSRAIWPLVPFLSEHASQALLPYQSDDAAAKLVCADVCPQLPELQRAIEQMKIVIDLAKSIRQRKRIPVDHALGEIVIIHSDDGFLENIVAMKSYILAELNVGQLTTGTDTSPYGMRLKAKPIFVRLHQRSDYRALAQYIRKMTEKHIQQRLLDGDFCDATKINMGDFSIVYVQKGNSELNHFEARTRDKLVVLLNTQLADEGAQRLCAANEIIGHISELKNMIHYKRHNYLRIFYTTLQYSCDRQAPTVLRSIIDEHLAMIEGAIRTEFRVLRNEHTWKTLIEDEFLILGVKLKILICRP